MLHNIFLNAINIKKKREKGHKGVGRSKKRLSGMPMNKQNFLNITFSHHGIFQTFFFNQFRYVFEIPTEITSFLYSVKVILLLKNFHQISQKKKKKMQT